MRKNKIEHRIGQIVIPTFSPTYLRIHLRTGSEISANIMHPIFWLLRPGFVIPLPISSLSVLFQHAQLFLLRLHIIYTYVVSNVLSLSLSLSLCLSLSSSENFQFGILHWMSSTPHNFTLSVNIFSFTLWPELSWVGWFARRRTFKSLSLFRQFLLIAFFYFDSSVSVSVWNLFCANYLFCVLFTRFFYSI